MPIIITKALASADITFLWEMLYQAAIVDPTCAQMTKETVLNLPSIKKYLSHWGRTGDMALIAWDEDNKQPLGAAWIRLFKKNDPGYGYIADDIPELSMAVLPEHRGHGVGTLLLQAIVNEAKKEDYKFLSLSVDKQNRARKLYEKMGFVDANLSQPEDTSITLKMIL